MSISKINNFKNFNYNAGLINFKSDQSRDSKDNNVFRHNFTDDELYYIASKGPQKVLKDVYKNSLKAMFIAVPLVDAAVSAVAQRGSLSKKLSKSISTLGKWGVGFAAGLSVLAAKKVINNHSDKLNDFDKKHSVISFGIDAFAIMTAINAAVIMKNKSKAFIYKHLPVAFKNATKTAKNSARQFIDSSLLNKKVVRPVENYLAKKAYYRPTVKIASLLVAPAISIAAFCRVVNEAKKQHDNTIMNYMMLDFLNNLQLVDSSAKEDIKTDSIAD